MAGNDVGLDGTMKDYCDILRTKGQDAAIGVEVLRFDTSEVLRGEFNGKELEQAFSFADELARRRGDQTYESFSIVTDDSNTIQVEVPDEWTDVRGEAQEIAGVHAPSIQASPDVDDVPQHVRRARHGVRAQSDQFTPDDFETILDAIGPSEFCTSDGREDYSDPIFTGRFEVWDGLPGHRCLSTSSWWPPRQTRPKWRSSPCRRSTTVTSTPSTTSSTRSAPHPPILEPGD